MPDEKTIHLAPPKKIEKAAVFALSMLGLFLLFEAVGSFRALGVPPVPVDTITVTGTGQVSLAPDIAHVTFTVEHSAPTVAAAQAAATKQGNAAIAFVEAQRIAEKDVTTLSYSVSPEYAYSSPCPLGAACPVYQAPKITGYRVAETVRVTVRDFDKVSGLLEGLGSQSVENISGPDFALESPTAGTDAARAKAIENARTQAEILARQLGVSLGRVVSFNEGAYPLYGVDGGYAAKSADSGAPAPTIPVGENQYSASVSITYEIR